MSDIATKLTTIAENQQKVYDAGYAKGQAEGGDTEEAYQQGVTDGKQAYWDIIWDGIQLGGEREDYVKAFHKYWNADNFKPKYDMTPTSGTLMFDRFGGQANTDAPAVDLAELLEQAGVKLDTSKMTNFANIFYYSSVSRVPEISVVGSTTKLTGMFALCRKLYKIDKLILKENGEDEFNSTFTQAVALTDIVIEGVIGKNGLDLSHSTLLSKASIISIVNALSATTSGLSIILSRTAVTNAFGSTTADEWTALIATKSKWTISLV